MGVGTALSYCEELTLAENSDWRLPNIKELESIVDETKYEPAIDTAYFSVEYNTEYVPVYKRFYYYWSSTSSASDPSKGFFVEFMYGHVSGNTFKWSSRYVRCVRSE